MSHDLDSSKSPVFFYAILACLALFVAATFYFRSDILAIIDQTQTAKKKVDLKALSARLDLPRELPPVVVSQFSLLEYLDRLNREKCDKSAVSLLADALADKGYPRDAADFLLSIGRQCNNDDALYQSVRFLNNISDYQTVVAVVTKLITSTPSSYQLRYMRAEALRSLGKHEAAISDYVSTVELISETKSVSSTVYTAMANSYAALQRFCEAISPIQMWVAADPANRDTSQARATISEYSKNGNCKSSYALGSDKFFTSGGGTIKTAVQINGVTGTFIVDTGASLVSLDPAFAKKANVPIQRDNTIRLQTANGNVEGALGVAKAVKMGRLSSKDVAVVVGPVPLGGDIDGLLGMSFLARYEMVISGRERLTERSF